MILHPESFNRDGKHFVLLPLDEFRAVAEMIEDYQDLTDLRNARAADDDSPGVPLEDVLKRYGIKEP